MQGKPGQLEDLFQCILAAAHQKSHYYNKNMPVSSSVGKAAVIYTKLGVWSTESIYLTGTAVGTAVLYVDSYVYKGSSICKIQACL